MLALQSNFQEARKLIAEVIAADAGNADALALRAALHIEDGALDNAVADLRLALQQKPNSAPLMQSLAQALERKGSIELADEGFAVAMQTSAYDVQPTLTYVEFLLRRGHFDRAGQTAKDGLSRRSNEPTLLKALARIQLIKRDWTAAQATAQALTTLEGATSASNEILGLAQLGQHSYAESIGLLKSAIAAHPDSVKPMYALVTAYVRSGKATEADKFLNSVLQASPNNPDAQVLKGSLLLSRNEEDQARKAFETAIERSPSHPAGYLALANLHINKGSLGEAQSILERGRASTSEDFSLRFRLAEVLEASGNARRSARIL